jgi:hypothetical protein
MNPAQHPTPLQMVIYSTVGTIVIIGLIVLVRWLMSSAAWRYHPGGAGGFLKDELVRWGAILVPYLTLSIGFKFFIYDLHPELANKPEVWIPFIIAAIAFRFMLRRLPFIKAMGRHIDAARAEARAAKQGRAGRQSA